MKERQFLWGLSFGVTFLAIAGVFWLGLGVSSVLKTNSDWRLWFLLTVIQCGVLVSLLWASFRLRRRSGFTRRDFRSLDEEQRLSARRVRTKFFLTTFGQAFLIGIGVWWCVYKNAIDQIWPWISLVVSLHFIPLAKMFNVRTYYVIGLCGFAISIAAFIGILKPFTLIILGVVMAIVMWLSATYIVFNSKNITSKAMSDIKSV